MVAWMAVYAGASAAYLAGDFVYHRFFREPDAVKFKPQDINIPRTDEGAPVPLIYGRCRVRQPVLAWCGTPESEAGTVGNGYPTTSYKYALDLYFVVGIGFNDGAASESGFHKIYIGDEFLLWSPDEPTANEALTLALSQSDFGDEGPVGGAAQWYDGNAAQQHMSGSPVTPLTEFGAAINAALPATGGHRFRIPAFRGYTSVFLTDTVGQWAIGSSPSMESYSFEVSSYQTTGYPASGVFAKIGQDSNPINVLWDLLKCKFGKLGIPVEFLDTASFQSAASRLYAEGHGYSRSMEDVKDGSEWILEILRQIDGVLYEDPSTGTIKIKLIRNDFSPSSIRQITKDNCVSITNWSMSSPSGIPNAVRVLYTDADNDYNDNTSIAKLGANATGQSNQVRWVMKHFPGCTNATLAHTLAHRELAAEGRCVTKMRATLDRSAYNITPGEAVRVTWSGGPDIAGQIFRVASVDRGTLTDGAITVDLISDYFYTVRSQVPRDPPLPIRSSKEEL